MNRNGTKPDWAQVTAGPEVSVVVPTYRRPAMLARCLGALASQDISPRRYEIVVCDDGPDEATRKRVEDFAAAHGWHGCSVRYVPVTETQGPAGARNCGWRAARGEIIAFTDDDTIPDRSWLNHGLRAMGMKGETEIGAVAGRIHVPLGEEPTDYELDAAGLGNAEFATANCFVRRHLLARVGGFDERYTAAWREDSDLQFSLLEAGATIARADGAVVVHPVRPGPWGVSITQQKKSQFDALLFKKHRRFYESRIAGSPPLRYYVITLSFVVAIAGAAAGSALLVGLGFAGWMMLAGWFAYERLQRTAHTPRHVAEMIWTSLVIPPLSVFWRLYGALKFRVGFW